VLPPVRGSAGPEAGVGTDRASEPTGGSRAGGRAAGAPKGGGSDEPAGAAAERGGSRAAGAGDRPAAGRGADDVSAGGGEVEPTGGGAPAGAGREGVPAGGSPVQPAAAGDLQGAGFAGSEGVSTGEDHRRQPGDEAGEAAADQPEAEPAAVAAEPGEAKPSGEAAAEGAEAEPAAVAAEPGEAKPSGEAAAEGREAEPAAVAAEPGEAKPSGEAAAEGREAKAEQPEAKAEQPEAGADREAEPTREAGAERRNRRFAGLLIGVLLGLLGFALAVQVRSNTSTSGLPAARQEDLVRILDELSSREDRLRRQIAELEAARARLSTTGDRSSAALAEARKRSTALGILAGTLPAQGPGVELTLTDPERRLAAEDLLDAVEELRAAGAEAVQVGGVRIGLDSSFTAADGGIAVDGVRLTAPYTILAIGDPPTLATAMEIPGGVADTAGRAGGEARIGQRDRVVIRALRPLKEPQYSRPSDGGR
jgi:uncharacterized protein YlxW (UPF0749 family)